MKCLLFLCKHSRVVNGKCYDVKDYAPFKIRHPKPTGVALESVDLESNSVMAGDPQECC